MRCTKVDFAVAPPCASVSEAARPIIEAVCGPGPIIVAVPWRVWSPECGRGDATIDNILKPDTLTLFLYFVLPGFVAVKVYDLLIPTERRDFGASLIEVVSYSLFNWVLFAWLLTVHDAADPSVLDFGGSWWARIAYVFVSPALLALLVYAFRRRQFGPVNWALDRLHVSIVHPMPTAWDEFISRREPCFMLFHLKSKDLVGARFSTDSFATTWPGPQQVYVEELWIVNPNTRAFVRRAPNTKGAIIKLEDCDFVEMYTGQPLRPLPARSTP